MACIKIVRTPLKLKENENITDTTPVRTLTTISHALVAAPVRLPAKVLAVARYVALGTTLLQRLCRHRKK